MMYECRLPEKKRRLFTVLSDIGRLILFAGVLLYMACGADGLRTVIISATFLLTLLASGFALIGMIVMMIQRLKIIDRIVTKNSLSAALALRYTALWQRAYFRWYR